MKEKFVNKGISFISKYQECDDLKMKRLKYGLEGLYSLLFKLTVVTIIALITNNIQETLLFLLFYSGVRTFSFGIHAKSNLACWITTIIIYNIIPLLIKNYTAPSYIGYIVIGISFISMLLWAPADTPNRPLIRKKQRIKCKILSITVVILYILIYIFNNTTIINNALIYALLVQSIIINPITYKITKTQFNNYKYYHKKSTVV